MLWRLYCCKQMVLYYYKSLNFPPSKRGSDNCAAVYTDTWRLLFTDVRTWSTIVLMSEIWWLESKIITSDVMRRCCSATHNIHVYVVCDVYACNYTALLKLSFVCASQYQSVSSTFRSLPLLRVFSTGGVLGVIRICKWIVTLFVLEKRS